MTSPSVPTSAPAATSPAATTAAATTTAAAAAPIGKLSTDTLKALGTALNTEHAAVWAYGLVAAYDPDDAALISDIRAGHLARRDATVTLIRQGGGTPSAPAAAYTLPAPVTDVASARALAATIETDCAAAWRSVIGATDNVELRSFALAGLSDSAVWLASLKQSAKAPVPTVPFPGTR